jgi:predicted Rossmann-fold nucleotide-binding protein
MPRDLIGLIGRPDVKAVIISQAIRNALEPFHTDWRHEDGIHHSFLTDEHMKRLNICIRHTVYDALCNLTAIFEGGPGTEVEDPMFWAWFQFETYNPETMEWPGSEALEAAFEEFVDGYEGEEETT